MRRIGPAFAALMSIMACACVGPISPSDLLPRPAGSLSVGQWSGTTAQGMPIMFYVGADETLTLIELGYDFNGCSGSKTFSDLAIPTTSNVTCMDGRCPAAVTTYRSFAYSEGPIEGPRTQINGLFLPRNQAKGQIGFFEFPGCGTARAVTWTATRQR